MNKEILDEEIYYYKNVIEDPKALIEAIEKTELKEFGYAMSPWEEWQACSGEMYTYGTHKKVFRSGIESLLDPDRSEISYIFDIISKAFKDVAEDFALSKKIEGKPNLYVDFEIKKYMAGTMMGGHFDQQEGDDRLRYSLVLYLNDDYEGGEISFSIKGYDALDHEERPHQDYEVAKSTDKITFGIKPEAGSCLIFPSSAPYHHTAHLIKDGFKYMVPMHWLHEKNLDSSETPKNAM